MAWANVYLVRSTSAAWERGDFSPVEWAHPEIEWGGVDGPEPGRRTGLAETAEGRRDLLSVWDDVGAEAKEYRELDDGGEHH